MVRDRRPDRAGSAFLILWIPGVIYLAEIVYRWISRNRHLLSRVFGCKGACALMPARKRDNEAAPQ